MTHNKEIRPQKLNSSIMVRGGKDRRRKHREKKRGAQKINSPIMVREGWYTPSQFWEVLEDDDWGGVGER